MPPSLPRTLADYPWVEVNVSCKLCARRGRYRLARLAARYGPDQTLDGLLADLAHGCPYWRSKPRQYEVRCGARFEDLDRLRPADIVPENVRGFANGNVLPRKKPPPRESSEAHRSTGRDGKGPTSGTGPGAGRYPAGQGRTLSSWEGDLLTIACDKCGRRDAYQVKDLLTAEGDVRLTDLRATLTAECPRTIKGDMSDWCGARFEP